MEIEISKIIQVMDDYIDHSKKEKKTELELFKYHVEYWLNLKQSQYISEMAKHFGAEV